MPLKKKSTCLLATSTSSHSSSQISMRVLSLEIHIHFEQAEGGLVVLYVYCFTKWSV